MSKSNKMAKSVLIMVVLGIGSKLLGFIREMLIASKFGSGFETDTFFIAITAVSLFVAIFTQSINTTLIPVLSDIYKESGEKGKQRYVNNLINISIVLSLAIMFIAWFVSPLIVKLVAQGFEGEQFKLTVKLIRIGIPAILFSAIVGVYRGYLQSESRFLESSASQFPFNFTYIIFLIFLSSFFGIKGLMVASVVAVFSQIIIQIPGIAKLNYHYKWVLDFKDPNIKKILYLILPVIVSVAVNDLNKIIDRSLASNLIEGSISSLNYAARLNSLILSVFITAIATVLFPALSSEALKSSYEGFKKLVRNGVNIIVIITIPAMVGMIILSEPIVRLTFERGAFNSTATEMTSQALIFYTLGLLAMALRTFMEKAYYSLQDTKTPMINGFFAVGLNVIFNLILVGPMQHRGLALATSIATTLTTSYLFYGLKKKIGSLGINELIKCAVKSIIASIIMGLGVYVSYHYLINLFSSSGIIELAVLLLSILMGAIIYLGTLYLMKVEEMNWFIKTLQKKIIKKSA